MQHVAHVVVCSGIVKPAGNALGGLKWNAAAIVERMYL